MIIKKTFHILMLILNITVIAAMFLGKSTAWISPQQNTLPTVLGLMFPYVAIISCLFILFWLFRRQWLIAAIAALSMLFFGGELQSTFSLFKTSGNKPENATEIKVLTYNVAYFGFFNKKEDSIFDYIVQSGADIVCLQEFGFYKTSNRYFDKDKLEKKMSAYPYQSLHLSERANGRMIGMAIYSKYPIVNDDTFLKESLLTLPLSRRMYADIKIGNDTLRVFNVYLKSNSLNKKDKTSLFTMADNFDTSALDSVAGNVLSKIGMAARIRSIQVQHIAKLIDKSTHPVIVCGDFNDTPVSYTYKTIGKRLNDAFMGSGKGMGSTYNEHLIRVRIDYLLHSKNITSSDYKTDKVKYSDHYPVQASFWLQKGK